MNSKQEGAIGVIVVFAVIFFFFLVNLASMVWGFGLEVKSWFWVAIPYVLLCAIHVAKEIKD